MRLNAAAGITLFDHRPAVAPALERTRFAGTPGKIKSRMTPEASEASRSTSRWHEDGRTGAVA